MDINSQILGMFGEIDNEIALENEIRELADNWATRLLKSSPQNLWIKGKQYTASYKRTNNNMQIVLIDHVRLSIAGTHYKPAAYDLLFDENFSELENLEKLFQTILYYKYDMIRTEDIVEEDDSVWQIQKKQ